MRHRETASCTGVLMARNDACTGQQNPFIAPKKLTQRTTRSRRVKDALWSALLGQPKRASSKICPRRTVPSEPGHITQLLHEVSDGDQSARETLLEQVYAQLRAIAQQRISRERPDHTLQATALVHEAYL